MEMENSERMDISQNSNRNNEELIETLKDLSGIFSSEGQQKLEKRNEKTEKLLTQLKNEVQRISNELDYDYSDYEERLIQTDKYIEEVKRRLLEEESELGAIRKELIGMFEGMEEVMEKKFFREYLEDLVYKKMKNNKLKRYSNLILIDGKLIKRWQEDKEKLKEELFNAQFLRRINFKGNQLGEGKLGKEELKAIFENLQNVRSINLGFNNLGKLGKEELKAIFQNLQNIRSINLNGNKLGKLGEEELKVVFENLQNVRSISLRHNNLGELGKEELRVIFENLQNVRNIELTQNHLGKLSKEELRTIFENLQNVRNIELENNSLGELGEEELRAIFQNLQNVKSIRLADNNLGKLGTTELKAIFENLQNVRTTVNLRREDFSEGQKEYIQSLLPNYVKIEFKSQ